MASTWCNSSVVQTLVHLHFNFMCCWLFIWNLNKRKVSKYKPSSFLRRLWSQSVQLQSKIRINVLYIHTHTRTSLLCTSALRFIYFSVYTHLYGKKKNKGSKIIFLVFDLVNSSVVRDCSGAIVCFCVMFELESPLRHTHFGGQCADSSRHPFKPQLNTKIIKTLKSTYRK